MICSRSVWPIMCQLVPGQGRISVTSSQKWSSQTPTATIIACQFRLFYLETHLQNPISLGYHNANCTPVTCSKSLMPTQMTQPGYMRKVRQEVVVQRQPAVVQVAQLPWSKDLLSPVTTRSTWHEIHVVCPVNQWLVLCMQGSPNATSLRLGAHSCVRSDLTVWEVCFQIKSTDARRKNRGNISESVADWAYLGLQTCRKLRYFEDL